MILLPQTSMDSAKILAERIRKKIEAKPAYYEGKTISYTVSLGLASFDKSYCLDRLCRSGTLPVQTRWP